MALDGQANLQANLQTNLQARLIATGLREAWGTAFATRDINALVALYSEDALFFGSTATLYRGRSGVRVYFETLRKDIVLDAFEPAEISLASAGIIIAAGYWNFLFDGQLRPYRLTWTIVREEAEWRIAAHHASPRD